MYAITVGMIKMSSLSLYLRIFPSENFKLVVRCTMAFIVVMTIAVVLSTMLQCLPISSNWTFSEWATRKCINRVDQQLASSVLSFATDIFVLLLPIKYLIRLPISTRDKIQVIVLMCLGAVTCIASVARFPYIHMMASSKDSTYDGWLLSFWTAVEFYLGMITTCMPAVKPFYTKYIRRLWRPDVEMLTTQESKDDAYYSHQSQFTYPAMSSNGQVSSIG